MMHEFLGIPSTALLGRLLRTPLRLVPDGLVIRVLRGPLRGKRWITGSSVHGCWLGSYEHEKQRAFAGAVSPGDVVFDVGAHVGFYTLLSSKLVGLTGHVVAFEPVPGNLDLLKRHCRLNDCANVTAIEAAVSDRLGIAAFDSQRGRSYEGHIRESGKLHVQLVTLDELTGGGELPAPNIIKIDVEGAEFSVLTGAKMLLRRARPEIFLATHGAQVHRQCCDLLTDLGYTLSALDGRSVEETDELIAYPSNSV